MNTIDIALPMGLMADAETASIAIQVRRLINELRSKGATENEIDSLLLPDNKPSKIKIDSQGYLVIPEYRARIKLNPTERTLYILLLKNPAGINADELWRYWDELCKIYASQTRSDDIDQVETVVEAICDEEKVAWYTNVSRIKRKIAGTIGDRAALLYIIRRGEDALYRIDACTR